MKFAVAYFAVFILFISFVFAQGEANIFHVSKLKPKGILLDKDWKFIIGDNIQWAKRDFNDAGWKNINPSKDENQFESLFGKSVGWLRLSIWFDSAACIKLLALRVQQNAASEIYLDGKLLIKYGKLGDAIKKPVSYNPLNLPVPLQVTPGLHVFAVRICLPRYSSEVSYFSMSNNFFSTRIADWTETQQTVYNSFYNGFGFSLLKGGVFIILFFLHFAFFWFYQHQRAHLYFALFSFFNSLSFILYAILLYRIHDVELSNILKVPASSCLSLASWFLLQAVYELFKPKKGIMYWLLFVMLILGFISYLIPASWRLDWLPNWRLFYFPILVNTECLRISILSLRKTKRGKINSLAPYTIIPIFSLLAMLIAVQIKGSDREYSTLLFNFFINAAILSLPISISIYLALEFAFTNKKLIKVQAIRNRIARDLHDDLGSQLSTARMFLNSLKNNPRAYNGKELIEYSLNVVDSAINDLHLIMEDLQTLTLQDKGYLAATTELINKISGLQPIKFTLTHTGMDGRLEHKTEYNLYRITQELTNNTLKYAKAKNVVIDLVNRDNKVIFMYEDDGIGADIPFCKKGFGLANIISRSQSLGGSVEFDSKPGSGFRTIIELPLVYA